MATPTEEIASIKRHARVAIVPTTQDDYQQLVPESEQRAAESCSRAVAIAPEVQPIATIRRKRGP